MYSLDPLTLTTTLVTLWNRGSILLWALAAASLVAVAGATAVIGIDAEITGPARAFPLWLFVIAVAVAVLAAFKTYHERTVQTIRLVPSDNSFAHAARQPDGTTLTQIAVDFEVYNLIDRTVWLTEAKIARPKGRALHSMVVLRDQDSQYHGRSYALPA
jgi:hypothetical protein